MKRILSIVLITLLMSVTAISYSQNKLKIGHINSNDVLEKMPARDSAKTKLEKYAKDVQNQYKAMQGELESKYSDYQSKEKDMTDLIKKTKMDELKDLQERMDNFQKSAQEDMQKKENDFFKPLYDKVKAVIEEVAKENGYTYILDTAQGYVLYFEPGDDILAAVKKKLNLK